MKLSHLAILLVLFTSACNKPTDNKPASSEQATTEPTLAPPLNKAHVVYTNTQSTIAGKPFLVKGIYAVNPEDFKRVSDYGFNVVQNYAFGSWTDEVIAAYLDGAHKQKLRVLFHLGVKKLTPELEATVKRRITKFKGHPALYAWYLSDEPKVEEIKPEDLIALYQWMKKTDPEHPVFSSNWELPSFKDACDVDMPQYYHGSPAGTRSTGKLAQRQKHSLADGEPWVGITNTHDAQEFTPMELRNIPSLSPSYLLNKNVGPAFATPSSLTKEEAQARIKIIKENLENPPFQTLPSFPDTPVKIRGNAFAMIAHGSNGIFYWRFQPEDSLGSYYTIFLRPKLRNSLKNTLKELDELWSRIGNPATNSTTWYDSELGNVFCWCRNQDKQITLITVNESLARHEVAIVVPGLKNIATATAKVSRENRTVTIENGILKDKFEGNQAHVYLIDLD